MYKYIAVYLHKWPANLNPPESMSVSRRESLPRVCDKCDNKNIRSSDSISQILG